jgi:hypothetical protein
MGVRVDVVVADQIMATMVMTMMVMTMMDVKIVQNKKAGEEETRTPEWIGHPPVQVVVIPGRWIISNHRRAFIIVIVVNYRRWNILTARR